MKANVVNVTICRCADVKAVRCSKFEACLPAGRFDVRSSMFEAEGCGLSFPSLAGFRSVSGRGNAKNAKRERLEGAKW